MIDDLSPSGYYPLREGRRKETKLELAKQGPVGPEANLNELVNSPGHKTMLPETSGIETSRADNSMMT